MCPMVRFPGHVVASGRLVHRSPTIDGGDNQSIDISSLASRHGDQCWHQLILPHLRRCCPPVLPSSYRLCNRRDRKRKCVQCVISVFRVLSGGDEAVFLVTRLFPQGHNPACHTGEFTKLNLVNVTGKFYHVTHCIIIGIRILIRPVWATQ